MYRNYKSYDKAQKYAVIDNILCRSYGNDIFLSIYDHNKDINYVDNVADTHTEYERKMKNKFGENEHN